VETYSELRGAPAMAVLAEHDLEAGRRFWRDTMGFEEVDYDERQYLATYRAGGGSYFAIYQHEGGSKCDHTQMSFAVQNLEWTAQNLRDHGARLEEYDLPYMKTVNGIADMGDGSKSLWFRDPGNNIIGVFQPTQEGWMKMESMMKAPAMQR
jgi:catechol 2,3-dioxygenase-like lactoylglutathione lyase family enzyme